MIMTTHNPNHALLECGLYRKLRLMTSELHPCSQL